MWYLLNLFRVLAADELVRVQPEGWKLSDEQFAVYSVGVRERLAV